MNRTRCGVCASPQLTAVDAWLQAGKPVLGAAKAFGISRGSIRTHVTLGHVPQTPVSTPAFPTTGLTDVDPVVALQTRLNQLHATDTSTWSPAQIDRHNEQIRRTAESLSRMKPPADTEGPAVKALKALQEIVAVQMEVIERYPEVRREISEALQAWKRERSEEVA